MSDHLHGPFGTDRFGQAAERFARFFGTPRFILGQTLLVAIWIALNVLAVTLRWDPYPFILLNLALSFQAAYAAPFIMMSQNRQRTSIARPPRTTSRSTSRLNSRSSFCITRSISCANRRS